MRSSHKHLLIIVTAVSVVADTLLIPFYPQYFAEVFAVEDARYVGFYLAVYCLVVMLSFPFWAALSRRVDLLRLLLVTQLAAGLLSIACYWITDLTMFWLASMLMMLFKASYLLVYPFILSHESKQQHGATIGILAVVVEFCAILGAVVGGIMLQWFEPRQAFLVMAAGDFIQIAACLWLIRQGMDARPKPVMQQDSVWQTEGVMHAPQETVVQAFETDAMTKGTLVRLSLLMFVFYFSAFLSYHFFTRYWQQLSVDDGELASAFVFAIPAFMALLGLWYNHISKRPVQPHRGLVLAMVLTAIGALVQSVPNEWWLLLGRCMFGWALFQAIVRLDLLLFQFSSASRYAIDYSRIRISQSLGVLVAVYAAGTIMSLYGGQWMFVISSFGLCLSLVCFLWLFKPEIELRKKQAHLVEE